jgi:hypothetical protein
VNVKEDGFRMFDCFRCGGDDGTGFVLGGTLHLKRTHDRKAREATKPANAPEGLNTVAAALWQACRPLCGVAADYLRARQCVIPPHDGDLRWLPALRHASGYVGPGLVALITDAATGKPLSLHRTWISPEGKTVGPRRQYWARLRKRGGVCRLWPLDAVSDELWVGEGLESCLSAPDAAAAAWSCLDAGNLAELMPIGNLERVRVLHIAADHDSAGLVAADKCATRWRTSGRIAHVYVPGLPDDDWNDVARRQAAITTASGT